MIIIPLLFLFGRDVAQSGKASECVVPNALAFVLRVPDALLRDDVGVREACHQIIGGCVTLGLSYHGRWYFTGQPTCSVLLWGSSDSSCVLSIFLFQSIFLFFFIHFPGVFFHGHIPLSYCE